MEDQIQWLQEHSRWQAVDGVAVERIGGTGLAADDPAGWTRALSQWIDGQPQCARYLVNLYGTPTHNQIAWHYLAWVKPRLRSAVFCSCSTKPGSPTHPRRYRPLLIRRETRDLLSDLDRTVDSEDPTRIELHEMALQQLSLYRRLDDNFVILLLGPRGIGKSTAVRRVFGSLEGDGRRLVEANCAGFGGDITMAHSHLFGHVEGPYTGANEPRPGRFAEADGGTLFLDEFHTLPPVVQDRLLTAIQTDDEGYYTYRPLGGTDPKAAKFQLVLGSNRDEALLRSLSTPDFWDRVNQRKVTLEGIPRGADRKRAWRSVWVKMKFDSVDPLDDETVSRAFGDWLEGRELGGNFRDLQRIAIWTFDLQRAENLDMAPHAGDVPEGPGPAWFRTLQQMWASDQLISQKAEDLREARADASPTHAAATNPSESEGAHYDFHSADAPDPGDLVDRARRDIADSLISAFGSAAAAELVLKARGHGPSAPTIRRWCKLGR